MLKLIQAFEKEAKVYNRDPNSIKELKLWFEAKQADVQEFVEENKDILAGEYGGYRSEMKSQGIKPLGFDEWAYDKYIEESAAGLTAAEEDEPNKEAAEEDRMIDLCVSCDHERGFHEPKCTECGCAEFVEAEFKEEAAGDTEDGGLEGFDETEQGMHALAENIVNGLKTIEQTGSRKQAEEAFEIINDILPEVDNDEKLYASVLEMSFEDAERLHEQLLDIRSRISEVSAPLSATTGKRKTKAGEDFLLPTQTSDVTKSTEEEQEEAEHSDRGTLIYEPATFKEVEKFYKEPAKNRKEIKTEVEEKHTYKLEKDETPAEKKLSK